MTEQFRVGDIVECKDMSPGAPGWGVPAHLRLGALYTISDIGPTTHPLADGQIVAWLKDHEPIQRVYHGTALWRLRLIRRPRADAFSDLLKVPADLRRENA